MWRKGSVTTHSYKNLRLASTSGQWYKTYLNIHHELLQEMQADSSLLVWASQSSDLDIIENMWVDFKQAVHAWQPENISELEEF